MSSPVFTITVTSAAGTRADEAAQELPRTDAAGERDDLHERRA